MEQKKFNKIYQFKITLLGIKPPIWRRIQIPETYSFWDLHVAIQDSMGWFDEHLHQFVITDPFTGITVEIGIPNDDGFIAEILASWKEAVAKYFIEPNSKGRYEYDFGDGWDHEIILEKILPREINIQYPVCIKGKRACPPEDCGGIPGYLDLLEVINDPEHEEYEEWMEWLGGDYDPEYFVPEEVSFDNPRERLKFVIGR